MAMMTVKNPQTNQQSTGFLELIITAEAQRSQSICFFFAFR
jgi:hypothetical protein